jgi:hypothetical protein
MSYIIFDNALSLGFILSLFYAGLTIYIQHLLHHLRIYYLLFRHVSFPVLGHLQEALEDGQEQIVKIAKNSSLRWPKTDREDSQQQIVKMAKNSSLRWPTAEGENGQQQLVKMVNNRS